MNRKQFMLWMEQHAKEPLPRSVIKRALGITGQQFSDLTSGSTRRQILELSPAGYRFLRHSTRKPARSKEEKNAWMRAYYQRTKGSIPREKWLQMRKDQAAERKAQKAAERARKVAAIKEELAQIAKAKKKREVPKLDFRRGIDMGPNLRMNPPDPVKREVETVDQFVARGGRIETLKPFAWSTELRNA